ncbi:histidine phosphatase family protein [Desulfosarcina widdelii]|nr:histidine phosphatase family protein [Desulfosarcina widdelii]
MRSVCLLIIILAGSIILPAFDSSADNNEMIARLKAGGHILMVRHALAPGSGDPDHFTIGDCATQRNLNETGRAQARSIGNWLRHIGVASARVYSSQWCRCLETASLMHLGPVKQLPALNSFYERIQDREPNISALKDFISRQPVDGELIVMVTHFVSIAAMTGESVSSGMGVLLELKEDAPYSVVGKLTFEN